MIGKCFAVFSEKKGKMWYMVNDRFGWGYSTLQACQKRSGWFEMVRFWDLKFNADLIFVQLYALPS